MTRIFKAVALGAALAFSTMLAACDSGSDALAEAETSDAGADGVVALSASAMAAPTTTAGNDAVRLAKQASFGPTKALVDRIEKIGAQGWLDEQFAATGSTYADLAKGVRTDVCTSGDTACSRRYFSRTTVAMRFYADAIAAPDQLRQRVAFALGQMMVASEQEVRSAAGLAALNQIFLTNAFGNFRTILSAVTLNGYMGDYLNMADSDKAAPSENYARELLQLFSMGPNQLNMNGTLKRDSTGGAIPNYGPDDIRGVSHALTGWTYARVGGAPITDGRARDYAKPMIAAPARYDSSEKRFLGTSVPAGASPQASVDAVIDAAFNNASTAPFVARHLIAHLVTPNPSSAYIGRVATVFANNGKGVRGDLKAVVRAILTDSEARNPPAGAPGKLKEPVLAMTSLARVIGFTTDGYAFVNRDTGLGQPVMRAPSVFNFYPVDYPLPGSATLYSPTSKLLNTSTTLRLHNFVQNWTVGGDPTRAEFMAPTGLGAASSSKPIWATWEAFGTNIDAMIETIDRLMFANTLGKDQRAAMKTAALAVTDADAKAQARKRAQLLLYIAGTSPMFLVDR